MGPFTYRSNGGQFTDRSNRDKEETMAIINQEKATINQSLAQINTLSGELRLTVDGKYIQ